ncbi:hypothetical protein DSL92_06220 [Billgrantia gudaonensis]|uniref:Uncharacterized protein n=1 Tax=Billgrantia gudaonensis TaxID=376427 RepID=A0A3S0QFW6_9GAMM|nr:hypothetical protein DSL92_06220 [Halomonas gudaonensis]
MPAQAWPLSITVSDRVLYPGFTACQGLWRWRGRHRYCSYISFRPERPTGNVFGYFAEQLSGGNRGFRSMRGPVMLRCSPALARLSRQNPETPLRTLLAKAIEQSFEALVSIMVNIVKAAGMASTIALPEVISSVNMLISEGGDATSLMTLLLAFYFIFVMVVMGLLNLLRKMVVSGLSEMMIHLWERTPFCWAVMVTIC